MKDFCPKCKKEIIEKINRNDEIQNFLKISFYKELCETCIKEFTELLHKAKTFPIAKNPSQCIEGIHFYKENSNYVFTEIYHLQKNYCCKNSCRHCPYGFKKELN